MLTMEWVEGVKLNDRKGMVAHRIRPRDAAKELLKAFAQMIFIHGYVHADPHGGNILVRPRPGPPCESSLTCICSSHIHAYHITQLVYPLVHMAANVLPCPQCSP